MSNPRIVICGYFFSTEEARLGKGAFVQALTDTVKTKGYDLVVIENGEIGNSGTLALEADYKIPAYGFADRFALRDYIVGIVPALGHIRNDFRGFQDLMVRELKLAEYPTANAAQKLKSIVKGFFHVSALHAKIRQIQFQPSDLLLTWGTLPTLHSLLRRKASSHGATLVVAEFGELQKCFFLSEMGLFEDAWPSVHKTIFKGLPLDEVDREKAVAWRNNLCLNRVSGKNYQGDLSPELKKWINGRKVLFVPGLYPLGSGLFPYRTAAAKKLSPLYQTNEEFLMAVTKIAEAHDFCVLYKDHPNTYAYTPSHQLFLDENDHVMIVGDADIHDVLNFTDLMVTLGSKSAFISLCRGVPVVLAAPFSLSGTGLVFEVTSCDVLEECILQGLTESEVNLSLLDDYNARLIKYYLYSQHDDGGKWFSRGPQEAASDLISFLEGDRPFVSLLSDDAGVSSSNLAVHN